MASYNYSFKILLLGDSASKTTLADRYLTKTFDEDIKMTVGADFYSKDLEIDGKRVVLRIWDIGGAQRFKPLLPSFGKGADGALFIYDVTKYTSINNIDDWLSIIRKKNRVDVPILVVGLLPDDDNLRSVSAEEGVKIAKSRNLSGYIECNLKTGKNVEEIFEDLTRLILADTSYNPSQRKAEESFLYCSNCKKTLTIGKFLNHPCVTTGVVSVSGAIMGDLKQRSSKRARKEQKSRSESDFQLGRIERPTAAAEVNCQFCGMKLTKEEQLTHSCKKKPEKNNKL